jgi:predicted esterase
MHVSSKIYLAQGTEDEDVDPASGDVLYAQLTARGRPAVYDRVKGADHNFNLKEMPQVNGWRELLDRIVKWYLT